MYALSIEREFDTEPEKLFDAFRNVSLIRQWFAPGAMIVPDASVDFKVGGRYRIVMQNDEGEQFIVGGEYLEIRENEKLVFTWQWEDSDMLTRVECLFTRNSNGKAQLTLNHSEFPDQERCDKHEQGWHGCLDKLGKLY